MTYLMSFIIYFNLYHVTYVAYVPVSQIGPKEMFESHEELKKMKSKSAERGKTLREKQRELEDELRKNQLLERDVERFKNRQKYMSRIGHLKKKKLWVVSNVIRCVRHPSANLTRHLLDKLTHVHVG